MAAGSRDIGGAGLRDGGNKFLDNPGVPGVTADPGLSDRIDSSKSPPLPELTVMCNGLLGPEPSDAMSI